MPVDYSIIIVNYNGGSKLVECVDSVFRFTSDFELIIVDNGSTDGSISQIANKFSEVEFIPNSKNIGFARANNLAIKKARGRWIVLLNPDTKVTSSWLNKLIKCAEVSDQIGIVTPKLLRIDEKTIDSTGQTFDFRSGYTRDRGAGEADHGQFDAIQEIASCSFACVAIRREVIIRTGLLDEKMILYFEDIDYCIRARIAGWKVLYCPRSIVLHVRGGLTPRFPTALQQRSIAYRLRIMLKCYNSRNAVRYGILRLGRDVIAVVAGIKNKDLQYFLSYLRSPIWNFMNPPIKERKFVQSTRTVSDESLASLL